MRVIKYPKLNGKLGRSSQFAFYKGWIKRLNGVAEKVGSKIRYPIEY